MGGDALGSGAVQARVVRRIRGMVWVFIVGLVVSGLTAIPLESEIRWVVEIAGGRSGSGGALASWLGRILDGLEMTNGKYPFLAYGTDWLAFGHFAIAILFVGALREPVRRRWLYDYGLALCALVIPFALIAGQFRGIPLGWRLVDCSFGVVGAAPLLLCRKWSGELARLDGAEARQK